MKKIFLRNILGGILFGLSFVVTIFVFVRAAGLTATNGEPLTVSKWTDMAANFFWGSGSGGIYYNGNVGIGTNSPNKNLHIYDTTNNAEIDLQSVVGTNKHWAIYQDKTNQNLYMWNGVNKVNITTGGNMDVLGKVNGIGGLCMNGDCKSTWSAVGASISNNYTGTCDSSHRGSTGVIGGYYKICNGTSWLIMFSLDNYFAGAGINADPYRLNGETANGTTVAATSCNYYNLNALTMTDGTIRSSGVCGNGTKACLPSGIYRINPSGSNSFNVYCDMSGNTGGRTLVIRIVADKLHLDVAAVGTILSDSQTSAGKFSDLVINAIPKTVGYRFTCASNTYFFSPLCVFKANDVTTDTYCSPSGYMGHYGLNTYSTISPLMAYGHSSQPGCYSPWGSSGVVRVK